MGIILTTLILSVSGNKEKLSDEEIKKRAMALGMEMAEVKNSDDSLDKVLENIVPSDKSILDPSTSPSATPTIEPSPQPTITPTVAPTTEPNEEPTAAPTSQPVTPSDNTQITDITTGQEITFTVESGMSSAKVATLLQEKGIIEDSSKFNKYIIDHGKANVIRVGTYTLPKGASYEEIINTITK